MCKKKNQRRRKAASNTLAAPHAPPTSKVDIFILPQNEVVVPVVNRPPSRAEPVQETPQQYPYPERSVNVQDYFHQEINESFSYHDVSFEGGQNPLDLNPPPKFAYGSQNSPGRNVYLAEMDYNCPSRPNENSLLIESLMRGNESRNSHLDQPSRSFGRWRPNFLRATSGHRSPSHMILDELDTSGYHASENPDFNPAWKTSRQQSDFILKTLVNSSDFKFDRLVVPEVTGLDGRHSPRIALPAQAGHQQRKESFDGNQKAIT